MRFQAFTPTKVLFGVGELNNLHGEKLPGKRALLVISNGRSTKANGYLSRTEKELEKAGVSLTVFDEIEPNPLAATVMRGGEAARKAGCDFIVALGGGSVMDASKGIAVMATNGGELWDYIKGGSGKGKPIAKAPLPIVAITTTAGTGSEVDCGGVITKPETHEKIGLVDPSLYPVLAIVDPELMTTVPPAYTAYQGFDALFHSTETYINRRANPVSDMVASAAIRNIGKYLARAVKDGGDIEARTGVAFANTMSGYSMETGGCTSEHSLEHAMSGRHQNLPHGAGLIMISVEYYKFFVEKHVCDERFTEMARLLGKTDASKAEDFLDALAALQKACGADNLKMSDYGIAEDEFDEMAANAGETMGRLFLSDRCELSHEDCVEIYRRSFR